MRVACTVATLGRNPVLRRELLEAYPDARINERTEPFTEDELIEFLRDCDAVITTERINERMLSALPKLKIISRYQVGLDNVDFEVMRRHGVKFGHEPGVNKLAVAELSIAFFIGGLRGISTVNMAMRGAQRPRPNLGRLLTGRVVGIHGCGNVGKEVVRLLQPFDCTILACDIKDYSEFYRRYNVAAVSFDELLRRSEVLSLHLPLTRATRNLYDATALAKLRSDCVLVNTCRGRIVDEAVLRQRLESGALIAACFDVFAVEPCTDDALLRLPSMLATPHIGASAEEIRLAMGRAAIKNLAHNAIPGPEYDEFQ